MIGLGFGLSLASGTRTEGGGGLLAATRAYFAAGIADGGAEAPEAYKSIVNTLVDGLNAAGLWSRLDFLHLLRGHDSKVSLVNLIDPATNKAALVNSPAFTAYVGMLGDGASAHLTTRFDPINGAQQFGRDSGHFGAWDVTDMAEIGSPLIGGTAAENNLFPRNTSNVMTGRVNSARAVTTSGMITDSRGYSLVTRTDANTVRLYKSGTQVAVDVANASSALATSVVYYLRSVLTYSARRIAIGHGGAGLTAQQVSDLNILFSAYIAATDALAA